nr:integrase, catalytic region, zinc finger, CCHC-type, peptidase aspartic, catalytic [Tanacetum cinerariifolium]
MNMSPENKAHFLAEKEAIHLILTRIGDKIYSTVDACQTTQEMWEAIESLQQGESLKIQDVKTNLFWEFGKFTSHDEESMESNYTRFYKLVNEMIKNNLTVTTMQSHRSSAPSSKPSIPTRSHTTTRYKGKEIAKPITPPSKTTSEEDSDPEQAQRDKDMQKNLALIAKCFKKIYKPTNNNLRTSSNSKNKNVDTTPWFKNDNQSGQFGNQRTVNVVATRENVGSKVVQQSGIQCFNCREFGHFVKECRTPKRVKDSAYHKEKMLLGKQAEQELEAHYNYMAKIQEVPTADSGTDSEPVEQVQNEVRYNVFANNLQHSEQSESVSNTCLVETNDSNVTPDSPDMCEDDIKNEQNDVESDDERVALANLIANLKLDTKQTEFEKYKAFNDRTIDYDKLERKLNEALGQLAQKDTVISKGLKMKAYELSVVKEKHDELMKQSLLTKSHYEGLVKQKTKVITDLKLREEHDIEKMLSMEKHLKFLNKIVYKRRQSIQTIHLMEPKVPTYNGRPTFVNPRYLKQAQSKIPCLYAFPYDQNTHANRLIPDGEETLALEKESRSKLNKDLVHTYDYTTLTSNVFRKEREQYFKIQDLKAQLQDKNIAISELKKLIEKGKGKSMYTKFDRPFVVRQPNAQRIPKPPVLGVNHTTKVSRPQLKCNQSRDKVLPNNSQVKAKKTQVEVHPRIPSVSNKMKSINVCKDSLNSRTLNANAVCATCNKYLVDSNHFACVTKMLNDVYARTKKPTVVPISIRKSKSQANKLVATHHKKQIALNSTNQKPQSYFRVLYENTSKAWKWWIEDKAHQDINRVYYVEGLNHNLFSVGQFCDADLEVAFRKSTCFVRDLQGNDLLTGNLRSDLYTISHQESTSSTPLCLMAKATLT